jgi:hypothetical protein
MSNRIFLNFLEYKLRGSQNRCFALPNFSYGKTTLNHNIQGLTPKFPRSFVSDEQLNQHIIEDKKWQKIEPIGKEIIKLV